MAQGSPQNVAVNVGSSDASPATLVRGKAGWAVRVMGYVLEAAQVGAGWPDSGVASVQFQDSVGTVLSGVMPIRAALPLVVPVVPQTGEDPGGYFQGAGGADLQLVVGNGPVTGHLSFCFVAV